MIEPGGLLQVDFPSFDRTPKPDSKKAWVPVSAGMSGLLELKALSTLA